MKLNLRIKILGLIFIPFAVLTIYNLFGVVDAFKNYNSAETLSLESKLFSQVSSLIHQNQIERAKSGLFLGEKISLDELNKQRELSDPYIVSSLEAVQNKKLPSELIGDLESFKKERKELHEKINSKSIVGKDSAKAYSKLISGLIQILVKAANHTHFDGHEAVLLSLVNLELAKENVGKLRAAGINVLSANQPISAVQISEIEALKTGAINLLSLPTLSISDETSAGIKAVLESNEWKSPMQTILSIIEKSAEGNYGIDSQEYFNNITNAIEQVYKHIKSELVKAESDLDAVKAASQKSLWINTITFLTMLLGLGFVSLKMTSNIVSTMLTVVDGMEKTADEVNKTTSELKSLATNVSAETQTSASALQEVVSSVEEIKSMITATADNAQKSQQLSNETLESATEGQNRMSQLNTSLSNIAASNEEFSEQAEKTNSEIQKMVEAISLIEQKTKVINDIVFQTKLLSFNASVEAARAGEHGKGFSVVAEEVANLSQVSGNAAQEIFEILKSSVDTFNQVAKDNKEKAEKLINESKSLIREGLQNSQECANCLDQIVSKSMEVKQSLEGISQATTEQSSGVQEIHKAMLELDKSSQSTAAAARQTTSSAESLSQENERLGTLVVELSSEIHGNA